MSQDKLHERLQIPVAKIFYSCTSEGRIAMPVTADTGTQSARSHFPSPASSRAQCFLHRTLQPVLAGLAYDCHESSSSFLPHTVAQSLFTLSTVQIRKSPTDEPKPRCLPSADSTASLFSTCSPPAMLVSWSLKNQTA